MLFGLPISEIFRTLYKTEFFSLKCADERYLLKRGNKDPTRELTATCLWSQTWSLDLSDLKCELTFCRPDPIVPPDSMVFREQLSTFSYVISVRKGPGAHPKLDNDW